MKLSALVYDLEIIKAIPPAGNADRIEGIDYCEGWHDKERMGISVLCAYDYMEDRYRIFSGQDLRLFFELARARDLLVGFNQVEFDNHVLHHADLNTDDRDSAPVFFTYAGKKAYDIYRETLAAAGLDPFPEVYQANHKGRGLDPLARANGLRPKTGSGAFAPVLWQQGKHLDVIEYCLHDVRLTKQLFDLILRREPLTDPPTGELIMPRNPLP